MPKLKNIYPGKILLEEFLQALEISQHEVVRGMNVLACRINQTSISVKEV